MQSASRKPCRLIWPVLKPGLHRASNLCSMHTYLLAVGSWRYHQLPTENRRSSVGVYQTPTRSSGLIGATPPIRNLNRRKSQSVLVGRCVPNANPIVGTNRQVCIEFRLDSTVGGKLTNHSYHFFLKYLTRVPIWRQSLLRWT